MERITVNLTEKSSAILEDAMKITGDNKTDCINKALQVYELFLGIQESGGTIYVKENGGEIERLRIL